jgi:hypothetical protein
VATSAQKQASAARRAKNRARGNARPYSRVRAKRIDDESLTNMVYTLTNPVKAGLVKWSPQLPGFTAIGWRFD